MAWKIFQILVSALLFAGKCLASYLMSFSSCLLNSQPAKNLVLPPEHHQWKRINWKSLHQGHTGEWVLQERVLQDYMEHSVKYSFILLLVTTFKFFTAHV